MKPKVFKIAGRWMWTCHHSAPVGDEFRAEHYRDPWCAALAAAVKHSAQWHNPAEGEDIA